jgi:hypothetical protein
VSREIGGRNGPVSDLPPEIPNVTIRSCFARLYLPQSGRGALARMAPDVLHDVRELVAHGELVEVALVHVEPLCETRVEVSVWKATSKAEPRRQQDWIPKGLQGGRAFSLAACGVATLCCFPTGAAGGPQA